VPSNNDVTFALGSEQKIWGCPEVAWPGAPEACDCRGEKELSSPKGPIPVRNQLQETMHKTPNSHHSAPSPRECGVALLAKLLGGSATC